MREKIKKNLFFFFSFFLTIFWNKDKIKEIKGGINMPTWAIHLATAKKVSEKINIDRNIFTFGNILPDIPNEYVVKGIKHHVSHARTHFETDILVVEHIEKRYDLRNFAEKYKNQIIEFDACITYLTNHGDNDTRYDLLLSAGDYVDENTVNPGPIFKFEDVNTYGMGIEDLYLPDYISIGSNIHVTAEIQSFSENEGVFFLNPVKVIPR